MQYSRRIMNCYNICALTICKCIIAEDEKLNVNDVSPRYDDYMQTLKCEFQFLSQC